MIDDLSSAVDVETEAELWDRLRERGRTIVAVSNRPLALPAPTRCSSYRAADSRAHGAAPEAVMALAELALAGYNRQTVFVGDSSVRRCVEPRMGLTYFFFVGVAARWSVG